MRTSFVAMLMLGSGISSARGATAPTLERLFADTCIRGRGVVAPGQGAILAPNRWPKLLYSLRGTTQFDVVLELRRPKHGYLAIGHLPGPRRDCILLSKAIGFPEIINEVNRTDLARKLPARNLNGVTVLDQDYGDARIVLLYLFGAGIMAESVVPIDDGKRPDTASP